MAALLDHPMRAYRILGPVLVVAFLLSSVGGGDATPSDGATYTVASLGWAVFGIAVVVTVLFTLAVIVHSVHGRRSATN